MPNEDKMAARFGKRERQQRLVDLSKKAMPKEQREAEEKLLKETPKAEPVKVGQTPGRNDPCPCGSGKKFKKCCGAKA